MGKHERQSIEEAEKIIVKILRSQKVTDFDRKNHWFNHALALGEKIKKDFPKINSARHLGNRYDNTGDILIISNGNDIFIEIKMSDMKLGVGTKANISQNALTENLLFTNKTISWKDFRQKNQHDKWVDDYLDRYSKYPKRILKIENKTSQKEEKARYLRELKKRGNKKAVSILDSISKRDRKEKIEYLNYLSSQKQQKEIIKRFFVLLILGIHQKEELKNLIDKDDLFQEIQNLFVYYSNSHKNKIIVRKEDVGERIQYLLTKFSDFKIVFPKGLTHCRLVGIESKSKKAIPLLQIVLHWKNIAQGIKTPCLNVFDLTAGINFGINRK
jgi:hypothetical protein